MQNILIKTKQKSFHDVIKKVNQTIYEPSQLIISDLEEEKKSIAQFMAEFSLD